MFKGRKFAKSSGKLATFMRGIIVSTAILISASFVMAAVASMSGDPTRVLGICALAALGLSAAVSGVAVCRMSGEEGLKISALCALMITLIMMLAGLITNGGKPPVSGIMNYVCYISIYIFAAALGRKRKGPKRKR